MAERFGGRYSPGAKAAPGAPGAQGAVEEAVAATRRVDAAGARSNLMWVPPVVAAFTSIAAEPTVLALGLAAAAALAAGAWLLREGLRAEAAFAARPAARRPALPRKILAALLAGAGAGLAAAANGTADAGPFLYGAVACVLHLAAFGVDPLRDKRVEGIDPFQQDRVARVTAEAEGYLLSMREAVASLADRALDARVAGFDALARRLIRTVEEDPGDLAAARRYLGVYLMGARDASVKFADLYRRTRDAHARADYEALLADLETNFAARTRSLLEGGRADLEIEVTVLRDRLRREGVAAPDARLDAPPERSP